MIHSIRFTAVLDTNVIYPVISRDLFFWFAHYDLYTPKWSKNIFDGWKQVMVRKGVSVQEALRRVEKANLAFPDALVTNYEGLTGYLSLPDENDRHVLAAAIKTNANVIVTNNVRDFPSEYLNSFGLVAKKADDFLTDIIDLNHDQSVAAFREMVSYKKKPPLNEYAVLEQLRKIKLTETANLLHKFL